MPSQNLPDCEVLKLAEVAKILKVSQRKIYYLLKDHKFPAPIKIGHSNRWQASTIRDYIKTGGQIKEC